MGTIIALIAEFDMVGKKDRRFSYKLVYIIHKFDINVLTCHNYSLQIQTTKYCVRRSDLLQIVIQQKHFQVCKDRTSS